MTSSILLSGSSHPKLAQELANYLHITLGLLKTEQFPDGETQVHIQEELSNKNVFIVQSLAQQPNHYLMELMIIIDAAKRAAAKNITAIIPYLAYGRQDRKDKSGAPITAKLIAKLLQTAGMSHLIVMDLHTDQIEGFFETNVTHLHFEEIIKDTLKGTIHEKFVIVSPDIGGVKIARRMSQILNTEMVLINKERLNSFDVSMKLIGDVKGKDVLIADDLCSTGGTLIAAAELCQKHGAKRIIGAVSHGLFVQDAIKKIENSPLEQLIITNSIDNSFVSSPVLKQVSIVPSLAQVILKTDL